MAENEGDEVDEEWRSHPLREFLRLRLEDGSIPIRGKDMGTAEVWNKYCDDYPRLFEGMNCNKKFAQRLGSLRRQMRDDRLRADQDQVAFNLYRLDFPYRDWNDNGDKMWYDSAAAEWLELDIEEGRYTDAMKPRDLYETRAEYQAFSLKVFRGHIYQYNDTKKYLHTLETRDAEKKEEKRIAREKKKIAAAKRAAKKAEKAAKAAAAGAAEGY
jgi:hypothetical protein